MQQNAYIGKGCTQEASFVTFIPAGIGRCPRWAAAMPAASHPLPEFLLYLWCQTLLMNEMNSFLGFINLDVSLTINCSCGGGGSSGCVVI